MSKELVAVLTKELGIGVGTATDIVTSCTPEQVDGAIEFLQTRKKHTGKIDNWDKYVTMMTYYFQKADNLRKEGKAREPMPLGRFPSNTPLKASREVKQASMDAIREFLNV